MPVKRHPTLSKGKKKTVTPDTVRKKFAKGAKKRKAKKMRAANKSPPKRVMSSNYFLRLVIASIAFEKISGPCQNASVKA
jgi:hypothetical protein